MSMTATLRFKMTDAEAVKLMCERNGWTEFRQVNDRCTFRVNRGYDGVVSVDLTTGNIRVALDGGSQSSMRQTIVKQDCRCSETESVIDQINEKFELEYGPALDIVVARRDGLTVTEGITSEGYVWTAVEARSTDALEELLT